MIKRNKYLNDLILRQNNGLVKVITGLRRSGKSFLLNEIFYNYLISSGVEQNQIIKFSFECQEDLDLLGEDIVNIQSHGLKVSYKKFINYINNLISDNKKYYLLLDEIQWLDGYSSVLNSYLAKKNIDIYVTGSNSSCLSKDIISQFRGRCDPVHIFPLSFSEFCSAYKGNKQEAWKEYSLHGGMPGLFKLVTDEQKTNYLNNLTVLTYLKDIQERHNISDNDTLISLLNVISSSIGSLISPRKLEKTYKSVQNKTISFVTIDKYINYFEDSFLLNRVLRYDIRGKKYFNALYKLYYEDIGLRNAQINFRQDEQNHIMENVIFNELKIRGYSVDVGQIVNSANKYEIDFLASKGNKKYYIQSTLSLQNKEKQSQETRSLRLIGDSSKKIIIVQDNIKPYTTEDGYLILNLFDFLLNENSLDL